MVVAVVAAAAAAAAAAAVAAAGAKDLVELIRGRRRESDVDDLVAWLNYPLAQGNRRC